MCLMLNSSSVTSTLFSFKNRCQEEPLLPKSTYVRLSGCVARGHHRVIFQTVRSLLRFTIVLPPFVGKTLGRAFHVNMTVNLCRKPEIAQFDTEERKLVPAPWGRAGMQNVSQAFSPNMRPTLVVALEIIPAFRDGNLFETVGGRIHEAFNRCEMCILIVMFGHNGSSLVS